MRRMNRAYEAENINIVNIFYNNSTNFVQNNMSDMLYLRYN